MININGLYLSKPKQLLKKCHLTIYNGTITGIIGSSGCGKTTLLQEIALMGYHQFSSYSFNDTHIHDLTKKDKNEFLRQNICFVMQDIYLFEELTIRETLQIYGGLNNRQLDNEDMFDTLNYVNLSLDLDTPVTILSGGEKQRLCIACGLLKDAELYIFDEPFSYLDYRNIQSIFTLIKKLAYEKHKLVVVSTHDTSLYDNFDYIYKMENHDLVLIKQGKEGCDYKEKENREFHFDVLKDYLMITLKKHKTKTILSALSLSFIIALLLTISNYNTYFQKRHGQSLLNIMDNQVLVIKKDFTLLTVHEQSIIRNAFPEYEVYSSYILSDVTFLRLIPFFDHEEKTFDIYKQIKDEAKINNDTIEKNIYMDYSLYKQIKDQPYHFYDEYLHETIDIIPSHILMPMTQDHETANVYIPYETFQTLAIENNIDLTELSVLSMKIPIISVQEIKRIESLLPKEFMLKKDAIIDKSIEIANVFSREYISVFLIVILMTLIFYKLYDIVKIRKDIVLFKINGITHKSLILMKVYQEIHSLLLNMIITPIIILIAFLFLDIFMLETYLEMLLYALMYNLFIFILVIAVYSFIVTTSRVSNLLRS